jgi:predicted acyl esterase
MSREPEAQTRRALLKHMGMAFGAGVLVSKTGLGRSAGAVEADQDAFTTRDVEIESFDGTTIVATVYEPTAEGPHPALLGTHGWAGDRTGSVTGPAEMYASNGYAGLIYDSRGFGESGGTVTLTGQKEEKDAKELISWLADREFVITDGPDNPRLGLDGGSYGGGIQTRLAANDDRVDAIIPRYTWHDLTQALFPNEVLKSGWALGLITAGTASGTLDPDFLDRSQTLIQEGKLDPDDRQYFESRSAVGYPDGPGAPTLVIQEFNDRLFPANEGVDNFRWAQEDGVETAMILGNGSTHSLAGSPPPGADAFDELVKESIIDWMDAHLKGGDHDLPPVTYYDQGDGEFVEVDQFPPRGATPETFSHSLDTPVTLSGPDAGPVTFDWELDQETEIVGTPSLELAVRPTGDGNSNLMAALVRVADGTATTIKDQVSAVDVNSETTVTFDMICVQQVLAPGETLRLALATGSGQLAEQRLDLGDGLFRSTDEGAGVEIRDTTAIELTVPTSVTPPPIVGDTQPTNPAGDGLYRHVRGEDEFTILDVQALFNNLDSPAVQEYAGAFNFSGTNPDAVTILDVQALFNDL